MRAAKVFHVAVGAARAVRLMPLIRAFCSGRGVILMLHEVQADPHRELRTGATPVFLDQALGWLRASGWDLVSLDEGVRRLAEGGRRFAVLTFDDGYRDTFERALPLAERHGAPITVFVPTGALNRSLYTWWLALRELFRSRDAVTIDAMDRRFHCPDLDSKISALKAVALWVHRDFHRAPMLAPLFSKAGISIPALNDAYFLTESELGGMARHPLVTVGAHTSSHRALATLDEASASTEMEENRTYLEALIDKAVHHFAYPYGGLACGPREATLAKRLGFVSAVTTRHGPVFSRDHEQLHLLPRIGFGSDCSLAVFDAKVSGFQSAALSLVGRS